jgi:hypothetical protein
LPPGTRPTSAKSLDANRVEVTEEGRMARLNALESRRHHHAVVQSICALFAMMSVAGCATFHNTLAQERVWAADQVCKGEVPGFRVQQVLPDGRYYWLVDEAGKAGRAQQCMARELQNWRGAQQPSGIAMPTPTTAATGGAAVAVASLKEALLPVWKVGDEWAYRYEGAAASGTYVWSIVRAEVMDGFDCYVIKTGEREIFFRKHDLATVRELVGGVVVRRDVPPRLHYQWPLVVGSKWQQDLTFENWRDKQTSSLSLSWEVVGAEDVTVPAGTFKTLKIVSRNERTSRPYYEIWYAPDVKQFVKIHEWREAGEQTRELIAYKLR